MSKKFDAWSRTPDPANPGRFIILRDGEVIASNVAPECVKQMENANFLGNFAESYHFGVENNILPLIGENKKASAYLTYMATTAMLLVNVTAGAP